MIIISVIIQLCLTISLRVHKTACSTKHRYCVETSHLICGAYWRISFFAVAMSTGGVFRAGYTISFFVSLALSLLDFLCPLLIIFRYSVYLVFFIKMFFQYSEWCFSNEQGFGQFWLPGIWRDVHRCHFMFTTTILEHPFVYFKVFHFQRCRLI